MPLSQSVYHSCLRVGAASIAVLLLLVSGLVSETAALLSHEAGRSMATAVSMTLGVAPTELNQITAALTAQEQQLAAREAALIEREIAVDLADGAPALDRSTFVLSAILFILLVLIVFNYVLDFSRQATDRRWQST